MNSDANQTGIQPRFTPREIDNPKNYEPHRLGRLASTLEKKMNLKTLALLTTLFFVAACSDKTETKKVGDTSLTGDSYNFYEIEENEMNEFRTMIFSWASNHGFSEIPESEYPLELKKEYGNSSSSSVILEPLESSYYKLWEVIDFSGTKIKVDEIHATYSQDSKALFETVEPFYTPPGNAPTSR